MATVGLHRADQHLHRTALGPVRAGAEQGGCHLRLMLGGLAAVHKYLCEGWAE